MEINTTTVKEFAKKHADGALVNSNGDLSSFRNFLTQLFNLIINDLKLKVNDNKILIEKQEREIEQIQKELEKDLKEKNNLTSKLEHTRLILKDAENGILEKPWMELIFLSTGLFLLTVFLWIFYAACLYGSLNPEIFEGSTNILSSAIDALKSLFPIAINSLIYIIFPIIFILIGYFAHSKRVPSKFMRFGMVAITFIVDCILGYIMASNTYSANAVFPDKWAPSMIFTDKNFFLLLFMGFVAYLIWGFVFSNIGKILEESTPTKQIINLRLDLSKLENDIRNIDIQITAKETRIKQSENYINALKSGKIPFSKASFRGEVATSVSEWQRSFIHFNPNSSIQVSDVLDNYLTDWELSTYSNPPNTILILD